MNKKIFFIISFLTYCFTADTAWLILFDPIGHQEVFDAPIATTLDQELEKTRAFVFNLLHNLPDRQDYLYYDELKSLKLPDGSYIWKLYYKLEHKIDPNKNIMGTAGIYI